jgi:hypothetical protein
MKTQIKRRQLNTKKNKNKNKKTLRKGGDPGSKTYLGATDRFGENTKVVYSANNIRALANEILQGNRTYSFESVQKTMNEPTMKTNLGYSILLYSQPEKMKLFVERFKQKNNIIYEMIKTIVENELIPQIRYEIENPHDPNNIFILDELFYTKSFDDPSIKDQFDKVLYNFYITYTNLNPTHRVANYLRNTFEADDIFNNIFQLSKKMHIFILRLAGIPIDLIKDNDDYFVGEKYTDFLERIKKMYLSKEKLLKFLIEFNSNYQLNFIANSYLVFKTEENYIEEAKKKQYAFIFHNLLKKIKKKLKRRYIFLSPDFSDIELLLTYFITSQCGESGFLSFNILKIAKLLGEMNAIVSTIPKTITYFTKLINNNVKIPDDLDTKISLKETNSKQNSESKFNLLIGELTNCFGKGDRDQGSCFVKVGELRDYFSEKINTCNELCAEFDKLLSSSQYLEKYYLMEQPTQKLLNSLINPTPTKRLSTFSHNSGIGLGESNTNNTVYETSNGKELRKINNTKYKNISNGKIYVYKKNGDLVSETTNV